MNKRKLAAIGLGMGGLWLFLGTKKPTASIPKPSASLSARPAIVTGIQPAQESELAVSNQEMLQQRRAYSYESKLRIKNFKPKVEKNAFVFPLHFSAISRYCINGDIDLIRRAVKPDKELLWTIEDQNGKILGTSRKVAAAKLDQPFIETIRFPITDKARYFRLSLCSPKRSDSCSEAKPVDFDKIELNNKPQALDSGLFFSQNFRVDASGIRIFDSREFKDLAAYKEYAETFDGDQNAAGFLEAMVGLQKSLRPLPVKIDKDGLSINLYIRDSTGC